MADNALSVVSANGTTQVNLASKDIGSGIQAISHVIVDASGNVQPTGDTVGRAGYTQITNGTISLGVFAEDAAHSSGDKGLLALAKRTDSAANSAGTDGDYCTINTDANGCLWVNANAVGTVTPGTAASSLGKAEDAAHSSGDVGVFALSVRTDSVASSAGTDGDYAALATDASGRLWVNAGVVGTITPGTAATSLGKAEDAAHTTGDTGVFVLAVQNATHTTALSGTDGDYTPVAVDSTGKVGIRGTFAEDTAHTGGDLGVFVLARRIDVAACSAGTSGDYATINQDANGLLWTRAQDDGPSWTSVYGVSGAAFTSADVSGAATAITDAPTSSQKLVITDLLVSSAAAITLTLTEQTSGTVLSKLYMAVNSTVQVQFRSKFKLATADKKLMVQASGAGGVSVLAHYYSEA